ncbi:hypothetical protein SAY86_002895 [Trapa natans]|uniref:Polygalacturonase n=1 Tax=Trapa natans TaxID=22666 RepID=A0AAN7LGU9_TRANT|nr:hypothetical protein SAY86_002895 [Trapa natans]
MPPVLPPPPPSRRSPVPPFLHTPPTKGHAPPAKQPSPSPPPSPHTPPKNGHAPPVKRPPPPPSHPTPPKNKHVPQSPKSPPPPAKKLPTFNIRNFGGKGDGNTDDTEAFTSTWLAACKVEGSTMLIPAGYKFVLRAVSLEGIQCKENIVFQLDGSIVAPENHDKWGGDRSHWIVFKRLTGFTIQGCGTIDGRGSRWWKLSSASDDTQDSGNDADDDYHEDSEENVGMFTANAGSSTSPTALMIYHSKNTILKGITIRNSPKFHVQIMNCNGVKVHDFTASSPGDSPNTDGIQVHRSRDIFHAVKWNDTRAGDDCIAIQKGCHNVNVHNVTCGPGHGISIGSLGTDHSRACVSNITVRDVNIHDTMNGVRMKTWQGGKGAVRGVTFSDIRMNQVKFPIIVDQYYCDRGSSGHGCTNQTTAVAVSGITYENIRGTYTDTAIYFACSDSVPCTNIVLDSIDLRPAKQLDHDSQLHDSLCWKVFGQWKSSHEPKVACLQAGKPSTYDRVRSNIDSC